MTHTESLERLYFDAPAGACEVAAAVTLRQLAWVQDLGALGALARMLAFEIEGLRDYVGLVALRNPQDLVACFAVPVIARAYALGHVPYLFVEWAEALATISWQPEASRLWDTPTLAALQRLVRRRGHFQHEFLKAIVRLALARMFTTTGTLLSAQAKLRAVEFVERECRVVEGDNATSNLHFGRDLILRCTQLHYLLFAISHELKHLFDKLPLSWAEQVGMDSMLPEVLDTIAPMLSQAVVLHGQPIQRGDPRTRIFRNGLSTVCTTEKTELGSALRFSMRHEGGPITLTEAARWALAILRALSVDPTTAAAAYSVAGTFHFGISGSGPMPASVEARVRSTEFIDYLQNLDADSQAWLESLRNNQRLTRDEQVLLALLGLTEKPVFYFCLHMDVTLAEHEMLNRVRFADLASVEPAFGAEAVRAAARCADNFTLRKLLKLGAATHGVHLAEIGESLSVVEGELGIQYYGPSSAEVMDILEMLQSVGHDLNQPLDARGTTLLMQLAVRSPAALSRLLSCNGIDCERRATDGSTALLIAAQCGTWDCVEVLLSKAARIEVTDLEGNTPLLAASGRGDSTIVAQLLAHGANVNRVNLKGLSPLLVAHNASVINLLCEQGADANAAAPDGATAIIQAAANAWGDVIEALLQHGADPNACSHAGIAAIHAAVISPSMWITDDKRVACLRQLVAGGAELNEETATGATALMLAAARGRTACVKYLLSLCEDVEQVDCAGNSALLHALMANSPEPGAVSALLDAGSAVSRQNHAGFSALALAAKLPENSSVRKLVLTAANGSETR